MRQLGATADYPLQLMEESQWGYIERALVWIGLPCLVLSRKQQLSLRKATVRLCFRYRQCMGIPPKKTSKQLLIVLQVTFILYCTGNSKVFTFLLLAIGKAHSQHCLLKPQRIQSQLDWVLLIIWSINWWSECRVKRHFIQILWM